VKFIKLPMVIVRLFMDKEFYKMSRWFNNGGFKANVAELRRKYPEVHLHTLEEWLREDGWANEGCLLSNLPRIMRLETGDL
jgi:hypothetical protein